MTTTTAETALKQGARGASLSETARAIMLLARREIRNVLREPAGFIPAMMIPLFFYFVQAASLENVAAGAGITNYRGFILPVSILFATTNEGAGFNLVQDIERGYFDKLLVSPISRAAIVIGGMGANFARVFFQGIVVSVIAVAAGLDFATGPIGIVMMVTIASIWGLAFGAVGVAVALKTGSAQAVQGAQVFVFPLLFLTTSFAPKEAMTGWLRTAVAFNPVTYVLDGMRAFAWTGWDADVIGRSFAITIALSVVTIGAAVAALRGRLR